MKKLLVITIMLAGCAQPGIPGSQGNQGSVGATGATGADGAQGPAGVNGTDVVPVKFCPGIASYPTTFPEYGLCINNKLYAVYSANDGFLTLLPNGTYISNAINSSCSFKVLDCLVQPL